MKVILDLHLDKIASHVFNETYHLDMTNISDVSLWNDNILPSSDLYQLVIDTPATTLRWLAVFKKVGDTPIQVTVLLNNNITNASVLGTVIQLTCDITTEQSFTALKYFFKNNLVTIYDIEEENKTSLILYRLNDERDHIHKDLINVGYLLGNFKSPLGIKRIEIDIEDYAIEDIYNFVYIPKLKRYYYVTDIQFMNNKFTRLILQEDVLMSWETLIKFQNAFITRQQNTYTSELFDNRLPLKDVLSVEDVTSNATDTPTDNLSNILLDFSMPYLATYQKDYFHILVTSFSNERDSQNGRYPYEAPSNSGLPDLSSTHNQYQWFTFIKDSEFGTLMRAIINDDVTASFIQSILWLPFDPSTIYPLEVGYVYAGDKKLSTTGGFVPVSDTEHVPLPCRWATESSGLRGVCPYLIIKDFTYTEELKGIEIEPYSNYEFYIPFVGWIKVESNKFFNKRILIYYNIDLVTGSATAFIYNFTDKLVIWSGTCQMGIKIDISTTNQLENVRQKQANENNMILSLLTSALSVGIGIASENPVAIAGGVLSAGKSLAQYVNSNNQIFERAQTTFGSGESAMHTNKDFKIRKTYHEPIPITESIYAKMQGYPSNQYISLSGLSGYTEVGEIHFDAKGYDIYSTEIDEIVQLLKSGVIL